MNSAFLAGVRANSPRSRNCFVLLAGLSVFLSTSVAMPGQTENTLGDCQKNAELVNRNLSELARLDAAAPPNDKAPDRFVRLCEFTRVTAIPAYERMLRDIQTNARGNNCPATTLDTMQETLKGALEDQRQMLGGLCKTSQ
jgi:hypothetical protein